jgi:CPA2 family monovalent cation:H+ antiporter-2
MAAGLARASAVVVTYPDTTTALKILANTKAHAPHVPVVVRTVDDRDLDKLTRAGATEVVPEMVEGSLMLASHALALVGVPVRKVWRHVQQQREARYKLLRDYYHGADDDTVDEIDQERLRTMVLPIAAHAIEHTIEQLALHGLRVRIVSVRRNGKPLADADDSTVLQAHDVLVLSGTASQLALAEERLLRG